MRGPVESGQYTSSDYTQTLDDNAVARSLGSTGDCYDNALAESFVDSLKTELIADRVWRSFEALEHELVCWFGWFNTARLHSSIGDVPPEEFEAAWEAENGSDPDDRSQAARDRKPSDGLSAPRISPAGADKADSGQIAEPDRVAEVGSPPGYARPTDSLRRAADEPEPPPTTLTLTTTEST